MDTKFTEPSSPSTNWGSPPNGRSAPVVPDREAPRKEQFEHTHRVELDVAVSQHREVNPRRSPDNIRTYVDVTGERTPGQQRLGVNLLSLIATLREEGRLPIRSVQWYLDDQAPQRGGHRERHPSHEQRAQPAVAAILDRIRASPAADETGWSGANGESERYFLRRGRGKSVRGLSDAFSGVLKAPTTRAPTRLGPRPANPLPQRRRKC